MAGSGGSRRAARARALDAEALDAEARDAEARDAEAALRRAEAGDPFPAVVSLGCVIAGICLFVHSTMPALAERRALDEVEQTARYHLEARIDKAIRLHHWLRELPFDPEALIVEFDRKGLMPEQAIEQTRSSRRQSSRRQSSARAR